MIPKQIHNMIRTTGLFALFLAVVVCHLYQEEHHGDVEVSDYIQSLVDDAVLSNMKVDTVDLENFMEKDEHNVYSSWLQRWLKTIIKKKEEKQYSFCSLPKPCDVSLPRDAKSECIAQRKKDIAIARIWYQITDEHKTSTILFPHKQIPWLNQTIDKVKFFYAVDEFESKWISIFGAWRGAIELIEKQIMESFKNYDLFTYEEYKAIFNAFENGIKRIGFHKRFGSHIDDETYTDIITNEKWHEDDIFVQELLTGICPWTLRKVTKSGTPGISETKLRTQLNPKFDFDNALSKAYLQDITLAQAIEEERLFVQYHEDANGVSTLPDILDKDPTGTRTLMNATSPITLLVLNREGQLKIAAIQWDYLPDSDVFTPASKTHDWLLAKGMVQQSHKIVCSLKFHLGHMHFVHPVYCLSFRRHLSKHHPLYDVFKFHCEGTVPHASLTYSSLLGEGQFGHQLFPQGHDGGMILTAKAYEQREYGMFNYPTLLKKTGLDDKRIKYNPFAEDGKLIWNELKRYATKVVKTYYNYDADVIRDTELQNLADELSADGKNGLGKLSGFPAKFASRADVIDFLVTFMWRPIIHATVNYNLSPVYVPLFPSKLYNDTRTAAEGSYPYNLPGVEVATILTSFSDTLSHFRINRLLDYHDKVQDRKLQKLAWESYSRLQGCINEKLRKRNKKRKEMGQISIPYLMPKWLTSSIHV